MAATAARDHDLPEVQVETVAHEEGDVKTIHGWHFVGDTLRDGQPVPKDGVWLAHAGPIVMCESGLHASRDPSDALQYAPGPILCRVEIRVDIIEGDDKIVGRERRILSRLDATDGLRYFARMQALSVLHLWAPPDVVLDYLMTGDDAIRDDAISAASAAASAARGAAWDAASAAARGAAWGDFNALVDEAFGVRT